MGLSHELFTALSTSTARLLDYRWRPWQSHFVPLCGRASIPAACPFGGGASAAAAWPSADPGNQSALGEGLADGECNSSAAALAVAQGAADRA